MRVYSQGPNEGSADVFGRVANLGLLPEAAGNLGVKVHQGGVVRLVGVFAPLVATIKHSK